MNRRHVRNRLYECNFCHREFVSNNALYKHRKTHSDETKYRYKCFSCGKGYAEKSKLKVERFITFHNILIDTESSCRNTNLFILATSTFNALCAIKCFVSVRLWRCIGRKCIETEIIIFFQKRPIFIYIRAQP